MNHPQTENEIKVFLASSSELELERVHVGDFFNDINSILADTSVRIRLLKWELFDPSFKGERKQSEYDNQVKKADIFIALFRTKAGMYTIEEAEVAQNAYTQNQMPQELYCFIQEYQGKREFDVDELKSNLGTDYVLDSFTDITDLKLKLMKILTPRLSSCGVSVTETEKFIQIGSVNILRKNGA
ncbi:MAG: hypothetical protein LBI14_06345 [Treponema sp.]|jgi:hypothetical protein|nr:hypothetical protein [Treponema sp.]